MILVDGDQTHVRPITANKTGLGFEALILTAHDMQQLSELSPSMLHAWVAYWQLGFKPPAESLSHKLPSIPTTGYEITR